MNREDEHIDIRNKLLKLPKVKAGADFENELLRRINLVEPENAKSKEREGFFSMLFGRKSMVWTVPAMSLTVVAIVVFGWYYIFNGKDLITNNQENSVVTRQTGETPAPPPSSVTKKDENIAGREITNDIETGKDSRIERKTEMKTGVNETYLESSRKTEKGINDEGRTGVQPNKTEEFMQKSIPEDRKGTDKYKIDEINTEMPKESLKKSIQTDKKVVSPMLKETDRLNKGDFEESEKSGKDIQAKDTTKVSKRKKATNEKEITKDVLETLSKKIKDNK
ncbi:MAG: hypothetical protein LWX07_08290 [Bacteroidetes bacterium]|nr:hypothetical protein [Bacteroidota bacterium]